MSPHGINLPGGFLSLTSDFKLFLNRLFMQTECEQGYSLVVKDTTGKIVAVCLNEVNRKSVSSDSSSGFFLSSFSLS